MQTYPGIANKLLEEIMQVDDGNLLKPGERMHQVLELLATGMNNHEIGVHLGISPRTVEIHRANLYKIYRVKNAPELVASHYKIRIQELEEENSMLRKELDSILDFIATKFDFKD